MNIKQTYFEQYIFEQQRNHEQLLFKIPPNTIYTIYLAVVNITYLFQIGVNI